MTLNSSQNKLTLNEFYELRTTTDEYLEFINGKVYLLPSPSTQHQHISSHLHFALFEYLQGKTYELFSSPFDIELHCSDIPENQVVIPDLSIICDKKGLTVNRYMGVPDFIIEILPPTNQAHDLITKLNLYMQYGVKEYWIVNPFENGILIYVLDDENRYKLKNILKGYDTAESIVLDGFSVNLVKVFK
ncbi:Uma2 family endonuclease [Alicyclobacillus tolerans]|uniref:Uma2 family endonuclease n=1 Tax=Alicyclobacillus tolerans TaxID=90970 RepID=UPI001F3D3E39|nr:Uma2 family endonuclease [Alicyclobacillus tolerans]MCF8564870.1 Uma2 family endonuclease [Alicyclobacillus tolerans]